MTNRISNTFFCASALLLVCSSAIAGQQSVVVTNKDALLKAVSPNSPYSVVSVKGVIRSLEELQLKDNLTLQGEGIRSRLVAAQGHGLLVLGKNNHIKNLSLAVEPYTSFPAIQNPKGNSVGNLELSYIKASGTIKLSVSDKSQDSRVSIDHTKININNAPATEEDIICAEEFLVQNNSLITVSKFSDNRLNTSGKLNLGLYNHAYTGGIIHYLGDINHNVIITNGKQADGIYNFTSGGSIQLDGGINNNNVRVNFIDSDGIYNHAVDQGTITIKDIQNNVILSNGMNGNGIWNSVETNGHIRLAGKFQNNVITAPDVDATGFANNSVTGGVIDFTNAIVAHNTITTKFPTTSPIINTADGDGSLVNFGFGSSEAVKNNLISQNVLTPPSDAGKVVNVSSNGGIIN
ncbi:MAG: hypothetical protein WBE18_07020 [Gammaproteobacteria bacterium]